MYVAWETTVRLTPVRSFVVGLALLASVAEATTGSCIPARDGHMVCPQPDAMCVVDRQGDVICSTPGGGIKFDRFGVAKCGPGYCSMDRQGNLFCSIAPGGRASMDLFGTPVCSESCVPAQAEACVRPAAER